jgi:tRNA(fMet)-specific endonuclease VapC
MSDLQQYIAKRKATDPDFAAGYDTGYADFRIGVLLRQVREEAGLTQDQVAQQLGTQKSAISRIENHAEHVTLFADEESAKTNLAQTEEIFLPSIVIGELYYGAKKSGRPTANLQRIDEFAASNVVLGCDSDTARHYGEVKHELQLKGQPIPENDVWIAAIALQHDLTLVTRDGHFAEIEVLRTARW